MKSSEIYPEHQFSRRERQIMNVVFSRGEATAVEIVSEIPDPPTLDAVRRMIRILEEKGALKHKKDGPRFVYYPSVQPEEARVSAMDQVVQTYFKGSVSQAMAALLEASSLDISDDELSLVKDLIDKAKKEGR